MRARLLPSLYRTLRLAPLAVAAWALTAGGCGTSNSPLDLTDGSEAGSGSTDDGSSRQQAGSGFGSSTGGAAANEGGSPADASASPASAGATRPAGADEGGLADVSTARGDSSAPPADAGSISADAGPLAYKGVANSPCADLARYKASWFYNWTLNPGSCTTPPFVPMIWGHTGAEQSASGIRSELQGVVSAGYREVLGFNEPDNGSQSNISVTNAISLWPAFTGDPSIRVGSPATQANSSGQTWFTDFMKQVNADTTGRLRVDFIAAHWYGWNAGSCDAAAAGLESYLKWLEAIPGNRPIWLTEWGCLNQSNPTAAAVQTFFSGAVAMFARHPRLERYAWYPWTTNNELVKSGALTALGDAFAAAPATR